MCADGGGFGLVDAGFGGEEDGVDAVRAAVAQDGGGGVSGHADDVFVRRGDGHALLADAKAVFGGVDVVVGGKFCEFEVVVRGVEAELVDADVHVVALRVGVGRGCRAGRRCCGSRGGRGRCGIHAQGGRWRR